MMWDIGGHGISSTNKSDRNRSRSPRPPFPRMPSPSFPIPGTTGLPFSSSMGSSYPPAGVATSYNSYLSYPSMFPNTPAPCPSSQYLHVIHHSTHHSSKNKHNDHHKHSGHGHSPSHSHSHSPSHSHSHSPSHSHPHSHSHSHSHSRSRSHSHSRLPSPSPMTSFPTNPSTSFPLPSPHVHFPTVPHRPLIHSRSTNALLKVPSHSYMQLQPPPIQPFKQTHNHLTKSKHKQPVTPPNYDFEYSKCTGRRRALCIGINYFGQENELRGCINDANNVRRFLIRNNYKDSEIMMLTEETNNLPTRDNILRAMQWLVHDARPHDSLFFHYSGHGGQTRDLDGDEADGWDEVIYPLDFRRKGHIVDDLMHDIMVKPLPRGCRLTALFDACHSGSVLDLRYVYSSHGRLKASPITARAQASKATPADVISWSSCQDGQTSADTFAGGVAVGAMSHAFVDALNMNPNQTYQELFRSIRLALHPRYSQKPQLGSSHQIDTNLRFIF